MKSKLPVKSEMPFYLSMAYIVFAQHDPAKVNIKQMLVLVITLGFCDRGFRCLFRRPKQCLGYYMSVT